MGYIKFRFEKADGSAHTAGFVLSDSDFRKRSISELSRMYPYSEAMKMERFIASDPYPTWDEAFAHQF